MTHALRADSILMKLFALTGQENALRRWQRSPFFSVPKDIYAEVTGDEVVDRAPMNSDAKPLPYDEFVLHLDGLFDETRMDMGGLLAFARVRAWHTIDADVAAKIRSLMPGADPRYAMDCAVVWEGNPALGNRWGAHMISLAGGWRMGQAVYVISNTTLLTNEGKHARVDDERLEEYMGELGQNLHAAANNLVAYLMQSPKHLLSVRATNPRCKPKTAKTMPWLRDDLATIMLMGPDDAVAAGQPRTTGGSVRAGPRPHARRGHWRRLGEADDGTIRKTFVRPAWIGPEAWEHAGRQYSLLRAAGEGKAV